MILDKFLKKYNVKSFLDLTSEEKKTYREWETVLEGRKITDDDVKLFIDTETETTIDKLTTRSNKERDDIFLKMKLEMLRKLRALLLAPEIERKTLEASIQSNIDQK
jgi:hypothetical protein